MILRTVRFCAIALTALPAFAATGPGKTQTGSFNGLGHRLINRIQILADASLTRAR
jgi:hypothetical protein